MGGRKATNLLLLTLNLYPRRWFGVLSLGVGRGWVGMLLSYTFNDCLYRSMFPPKCAVLGGSMGDSLGDSLGDILRNFLDKDRFLSGGGF
jgi:hypothetical protein